MGVAFSDGKVSASSFQVSGAVSRWGLLWGGFELVFAGIPVELTMGNKVGVATDGRGEVQIEFFRETVMAIVRSTVAGLLE